MPGIVGIIAASPREEFQDQLRAMVETMMYESFYRSGTYIDERAGFYSGWVAHEESFADCMPIFNAERSIVLLFAGEEAGGEPAGAETGIRKRHVKRGDARDLLPLYETAGERFLEDLNGWFSGLVADFRRDSILLFNDRYGMQRLYFHEADGAFYFSSEAKALLRVLPQLRKIDLESFGQVLSCGCAIGGRSVFAGVSLLPGASAWRFTKERRLEKRRYFRPESWEEKETLNEADFYERLKATLQAAVARCFAGPGQVAMSLTGGLDTRMILAARDFGPASLPCYTFAGGDRDTFDVRVAREVARACGQTHQVLRLGEDFFARFDEYAARTVYISDGGHDVCGAHDLYFNALAREIAPVRLTGKFGSELLRGVSNFDIVLPEKDLFDLEFYKQITEGTIALSTPKTRHNLSFAMFEEAPSREFGRLAVEQSQLVQRTPYMDNAVVSLMYQAPSVARRGRNLSLRLLQDGSPRLFGIATDRGFAGTSSAIAGSWYRLLNWFLFKAEWYLDEGMPHWMAKIDADLGAASPRHFIQGRHKYLHYRTWFQRELSQYVAAVLLDPRSLGRSYVNARGIKNAVHQHINGTRNYTIELNKLLTAELIHRAFID